MGVLKPALTSAASVLGSAVFACLLAATPAQGAIKMISGGECSVIDAALNGIRVDFCKNTSGVAVNDIHLEFTHAGLPKITLDYVQSLACDFGLAVRCFGPAVPNGGRWDGERGGAGDAANPLVWDRRELDSITDFNLDNVMVTGYWTKDGVRVPIPEPGTWALMIGGLAAVGLVVRRRRTAGRPA